MAPLHSADLPLVCSQEWLLLPSETNTALRLSCSFENRVSALLLRSKLNAGVFHKKLKLFINFQWHIWTLLAAPLSSRPWDTEAISEHAPLLRTDFMMRKRSGREMGLPDWEVLRSEPNRNSCLLMLLLNKHFPKWRAAVSLCKVLRWNWTTKISELM